VGGGRQISLRPLLALFGHRWSSSRGPLLRVDPTRRSGAVTSGFDPKRTCRSRTGALSRARLSYERMPNQSAKDERYPDGQRQQPIRKVGKVFPNG
jgi:hypothetical protein